MGEPQNLGIHQVAIVVPAKKFPDVMREISQIPGINETFGDIQAFTGEHYDIVRVAAEPKPELVHVGESLSQRSRNLAAEAFKSLEILQADIAKADSDFQDLNTQGPVTASLETDHAVAGIVSTRISNVLDELNFVLQLFTWADSAKDYLTVNEEQAQRSAVPKLEGF